MDETGVGEAGPGPVGSVGPVGPVGPVGEEVGEQGSGNVVTETRAGTGFTRVLFGSEGEVRITVGPEASVQVQADDNLLPHLETVVEADILRIRTARGVDIAPTRPPLFLLAVPELGEVELSGVGEINVESATSGIFAVTLSGVGDITIRSMDVDLLLYDLTGVGTVSIEGTVDDQRGGVAGQCRYRAADLASKRAMLQASEGGSAVLWVSDELQVDAIDNATVEYFGSPAVTGEVTGLATVTGLGER